MFPQWPGRPSKCHLSAISALVFRHTAAFLLLIHCSRGQTQIVAPSKPVLAMVGEDVILSCHLKPATDVAAMTVEWARLDLNPRFVLLRRDGVELHMTQNLLYAGRTSVSTNQLKQGDISLKLSKVKVSDKGTYKCNVPKLGSSTVEVVVGALSSPVVIIAEIDKAKSRAVLQCDSAGWYPEPEVFWLDGEGNLLSAGPPETVRGPDDLYTVSSRVTVEKRHSNSFTCRVTQKKTNQTRETEIQIAEDEFMVRSCSPAYLIVISCICVTFFSTVSFLLGRLLKTKEDKKRRRDEIEGQKGETERLISGHQKIEDFNEEMLKEKVAETNDMIYVISMLTDQQKDLEKSRDKLKSQLEEVESKRGKMAKRIKSLEDNYLLSKSGKKNNLLQDKEKLDQEKIECEKSLQTTVEKLQNQEEMIARITERKRKVENQIKHIKTQLEEKTRQENENQVRSEPSEGEEAKGNTD